MVCESFPDLWAGWQRGPNFFFKAVSSLRIYTAWPSFLMGRRFLDPQSALPPLGCVALGM